jgi:hypothetical protein
MRILFLHFNFPAQFRHLATALGQDPNHQVVFQALKLLCWATAQHSTLRREKITTL